MKISREDLKWAALKGVITDTQAEALWRALERRSDVQPRFDLAHLAFYFGALIVISAMGWFMTLAWEQFGGGGILAISIVYGACFALTGRTLWWKQGLKVPGGLLFTIDRKSVV